jgi:hypothetical protein
VTARDDDGRTAVYAAEEVAFGGTDATDDHDIAELAAAAAVLTAGEWWRSAGGPHVRVVAARRSAGSSTARAEPVPGAAVDVHVAAGQRTVATLAHELAHALAGVARGHDALFRAAHVDLTALLVGRAAALALTAAYRELGVPAASRAWPSPVRVTGDGFVVVP